MAYTTINKSTDYFNTKIWTGTGANLSITGVGHQPDFTWIKNRANTDDHNLFDVLRGFSTGSLLRSNTTGAATDTTEGIKSFDSDGFSLGTNGSSNGNGQGMVSWNWKANGAGSANTNGSINSTVSANTTSGFSIVSYTGTGSNATVGHGLGVAPSMIIAKELASNDWGVGHNSIGWTKYLLLNSTSAEATLSAMWQDTAPTSSVFSIGTNGKVNNSGNGYIAYCFAEKKGYSKFGSYTGNGNADGTFVYTGFKPAFVIVKKTTGDHWYMNDNKRDPHNLVTEIIFANVNSAESTSSAPNGSVLDFVSNGFKIRGTDGSHNASGVSYIYMAFGQSIVGSNNIPATAR